MIFITALSVTGEKYNTKNAALMAYVDASHVASGESKKYSFHYRSMSLNSHPQLKLLAGINSCE